MSTDFSNLLYREGEVDLEVTDLDTDLEVGLALRLLELLKKQLSLEYPLL